MLELIAAFSAEEEHYRITARRLLDNFIAAIGVLIGASLKYFSEVATLLPCMTPPAAACDETAHNG